MIGNVGAVFLFEWKRSLKLMRTLQWLALALFPAFIAGLVRFSMHESPVPGDVTWRQLSTWLLFALGPMLVCMLGGLFWTASAVSVELERRSWVYLAVRPNGGTAVLIGKYLAAVTWVITAALLSLTVAVPIIEPGDSWRVWRSMVSLVMISCPSYAAIFLILGVIWPRRAMVLSVAYTLIFELVISFAPAIINKITVQYRLRALAASWCELKIVGGTESGAMSLIGDEPPWQHIAILAAMTIGLLVGSVVILRATEFSTSSESDT